MNALDIKDLTIRFGENKVIEKLSLSLKKGDIGCIVGPSGCGKTTLLRAIAGFEKINNGSISLNEKIKSSTTYHEPPEVREVGMVFQDFALFPHLNIAENLSFGLHKQTKEQKRKRVLELLDLVRLSGYEKRYPYQLSGGQQQRIAFIRSLAPRPNLILLDEAFGSQDTELRTLLAREFAAILKHENTSAIIVTHDQMEAFSVADMMGVMFNGELLQWNPPYCIYHRPLSKKVAQFVGQGSFVNSTIISENNINTPFGLIDKEGAIADKYPSDIQLLIRPDDVIIDDKGEHNAKIIDRFFQGYVYLYILKLKDGTIINSLSPSHIIHKIGDTVSFTLDLKHCVSLKNK